MGLMDRRTFVRASVYAAAGATLWQQAVAGSAEKPSDDWPNPCRSSVWQKHGIILEATEPWEGTSIQNFTCPAEPMGGDAWRIWYSVSASPSGFALARAEGVPGKAMKKVPAQCTPGEPADGPFSIGNLPEKWKPVQVIHLHLRDGRHRLYFWAHGPRVVRYLAAESTDGRQYRVLDPLRPVLYHPSDRAAWGVTSPDGLLVHAEQSNERPADEPLAASRLLSNDATNVYQLPDGTFEIYSVGLIRVPKTDSAYVAHDNAPGLVRVIDRYTSADGLHLETRQRIIARDAKDPADQQFYYLSVTPTSPGRVGMLGHYRCQAQTMDLEWCFSRDGAHWERPLRRAWIERAEPPAPDCYGIYAGNQLVQHNGRWHLFYTGVNSAHNGKHSYGKPRQLVMYATADSIWG
jgi:hypothetical protein